MDDNEELPNFSLQFYFASRLCFLRSSCVLQTARVFTASGYVNKEPFYIS